MAEFCSLNSTERRRNNNDSTEIYTKGLDLWQQYYQQQQQQQHDHHRRTFSESSLGVINRNGVGLRSSYGAIVGSGGGGINCQDCGNTAKKDCTNLRCRTCCKSRGFRCETHVKSTWVPAAKRREKQQQLTVLQQQQQQLQLELHGGAGGRDGGSVRDNNNNNNGSKRIKEINSVLGLEVTNFPAEVNSTAMFRCVKVFTPTDDHHEQEQYGYQTAVNIGGHIFKGILYDQGFENQYIVHSVGSGGGDGDASSGGGGGDDGGGNLQYQQLNLLTSMASTNITELADTSNDQAEMALFDPSSLIYSTPLNDFMSGTQFFHAQRP